MKIYAKHVLLDTYPKKIQKKISIEKNSIFPWPQKTENDNSKGFSALIKLTMNARKENAEFVMN